MKKNQLIEVRWHDILAWTGKSWYCDKEIDEGAENGEKFEHRTLGYFLKRGKTLLTLAATIQVNETGKVDSYAGVWQIPLKAIIRIIPIKVAKK